MPKNEFLKPILSAVNEAYESGEGQIDQDLARGQRGDTLAEFIAIEIREVTEGCESFESTQEAALNAMQTALMELQEVVSALESLESPNE